MISALLKEVLAFIRKHSFYFWMALSIMVAGILVGLILPESMKMTFLLALVQKAKAMGDISVFDIFLNNLVVACILVIGGVVIFVPYLIILINGLMLGALIPILFSKMGGLGLLGGIAPHGVFELTAFLIAGMLGTMISARLLGRLRQVNWGELWIRISQTFVIFVLPLLIAAAILEVNVSPRVARALSPQLASLQFGVQPDPILEKLGKFGYKKIEKWDKNELKTFLGSSLDFTNITIQPYYQSDSNTISLVVFEWDLSAQSKQYALMRSFAKHLKRKIKIFTDDERSKFILFVWKDDSLPLSSLVSNVRENRDWIPTRFMSEKEQQWLNEDRRKKMVALGQIQSELKVFLSTNFTQKVQIKDKIFQDIFTKSDFGLTFSIYKEKRDYRALLFIDPNMGYSKKYFKLAFKRLKTLGFADQKLVLFDKANDVWVCLVWTDQAQSSVESLILFLENKGYVEWESPRNGEAEG